MICTIGAIGTAWTLFCVVILAKWVRKHRSARHRAGAEAVSDLTDQPCGYELDAIEKAARAGPGGLWLATGTVLHLIARARRAEELEKKP